MQYVMRRIVPETEAEPFHYWLRFEFGNNTGNPHTHGMNYVAGNKTFECVVADDEAREKLLKRKHPDLEGPNVIEMRTWEEAENRILSGLCAGNTPCQRASRRASVRLHH